MVQGGGLRPRDPFVCDSKMILFSGRPTSWYEVEMVTGRADLRGSLIPDSDVNAIGYNVLDYYIYGYDQTANQLIRVDDSGAVDVLTPRPQGLPAAFYHVGTLDLNGYYYLYMSGGAEILHRGFKAGFLNLFKTGGPGLRLYRTDGQLRYSALRTAARLVTGCGIPGKMSCMGWQMTEPYTGLSQTVR